MGIKNSRVIWQKWTVVKTLQTAMYACAIFAVIGCHSLQAGTDQWAAVNIVPTAKKPPMSSGAGAPARLPRLSSGPAIDPRISSAYQEDSDAANEQQKTAWVNTSASTTSWRLRSDDGSVYAALKRWSTQAGWQISWEIPVDFPVEIEDDATGSYEQAVRRVLTAFGVSDYPPYPCFHVNRVVRVVRRIQGNDDECR